MEDNKINIVNFLDNWRTDFIERIKLECNSKKQKFTFKDALERHDAKKISQRDKSLILANKFLRTKPLNDNDYHKYVSHYSSTGQRLNHDYFRHDLEKLEGYYKVSDKEFKALGKRSNPFSKIGFESYVCYMVLKLKGGYNLKTDDELFKVEIKDSREYNPLSKIPSVLRGVLPFTVKEYDIAKAFPTFIDIELDANFAPTIYDTINKKDFARILNTTKEIEGAEIEALRNELKPIYGDKSDLVITNVRFDEKGKAFRDFTKYEKNYIDFFTEANKLENFARLHDGVFVLSDTKCDQLKFESVNFVIKPCIKPAIREQAKKLFYNFEVDDKTGNEFIETTPVLYSDWFIQEGFKKISLPDNELLITRNSNNVIESFNHVQDIAEILKLGIVENEERATAVLNKIAKDVNGTIKEAWLLVKGEELNYYRDTKNSFGLAFKNGFFYFDDSTFKIKRKEYADVDGFFVKHPILNHSINSDLFSEYAPNQTSDFETFFKRATTGSDNPDPMIYLKFRQMFGYLLHNYKNPTFCPVIILSDEGADGEGRNGRRGKSLVQRALKLVTQVKIKSGGLKSSFNIESEFAFDDLEGKDRVFVVDDAEAGFKYDALYSMITSDSSIRRKGKSDLKLEFEDLPKFLVSTNYLVRYNEENSSDLARFQEFKFSNFYSANFTPEKDLGRKLFEGWSDHDWDLFYKFCFGCVIEFIKGDGKIERIVYDKANDNYLAKFSNGVFDERFTNTLHEISSSLDYNFEKGFSATEFLKKYADLYPKESYDKKLTDRNIKSFLDTYLKVKSPETDYDKGRRKWKYKSLLSEAQIKENGFNTYFSNDVILEKFEGTFNYFISELYDKKQGFSTIEFVNKYVDLYPQDKFKTLFNESNAKTYLDVYNSYKFPDLWRYDVDKKRFLLQTKNKKKVFF